MYIIWERCEILLSTFFPPRNQFLTNSVMCQKFPEVAINNPPRWRSLFSGIMRNNQEGIMRNNPIRKG